jgi:tRNA C32,U32 (ribose-2'-O)-methylase TrmJ
MFLTDVAREQREPVKIHTSKKLLNRTNKTLIDIDKINKSEGRQNNLKRQNRRVSFDSHEVATLEYIRED